MKKFIVLLVMVLLVVGYSAIAPLEADEESLIPLTKNYVVNGSFEKGLAGWSAKGGKMKIQRGGAVHGGSAAKVSFDKPSETTIRYGQRVSLDPRKTYTLSVSIKTPNLSATHREDRPDMKLKNALAGVQVLVIDRGWRWSAGVTVTATSPSWKRLSATFTPPPSPFYQVVIYIPKGIMGQVFIDSIQIEEGAAATEFTTQECRELVKMRAAIPDTLRGLEGCQKYLEGKANTMALATEMEAHIAALKAIDLRLRGRAAVRSDVNKFRAAVALAGNLGCFMWETEPFRSVTPKERPVSLAAPRKLKLRLYQGEVGDVALMLANPQAASTSFRVTATPTKAARQAGFAPDAIRLYQPAFIKINSESDVRVGDPLLPLGNAGVLILPGREASQLYIQVDGRRLKAGAYDVGIHFASLSQVKSRDIQLAIEVLPLALPQANLYIHPYGGVMSIPWSSPDPLAYQKLHREIGYNITVLSPSYCVPAFDRDGNITKQPNWQILDTIAVEAVKDGGHLALMYSFGTVLEVYAAQSGIEFMSPAFEKAARNWVNMLDTRFRKLGVPADRILVETYDEPSPNKEVWAKYRRFTPFLRKIIPSEWRTFVTVNETDPAQIAKLTPGTDIWALVIEHLTTKKVLDHYRATGKPIWGYRARYQAKAESPALYYRLFGFQAWEYGLTGWGFFAGMWSKEKPWKSMGAGKSECNFSLLYPGSEGPVTSRRWEAVRKGIEDYKACLLLQTLIQKARRAGVEAVAVAGAERALAESVRSAVARFVHYNRKHPYAPMPLNPPGVEDLAKARRRIADASLELQARLGGAKWNLVRNGDAETGALDNWQGFTAVATEGTHRGRNSFSCTGSRIVRSKAPIPVDPNKTYLLSVWVKSAGTVPSTLYAGYMPLDEKKNRIGAAHVVAWRGTETTLTENCVKGATALKIADASRWKIGKYNYVALNADASGAYADLPNRNVLRLAPNQALAKDAGPTMVHLLKPAPRAIPAGTAIRLHRSGSAYIYNAANGKKVETKWTEYTGRISGIAKSGNPMKQWWPGTRYARIVLLANYSQKKHAVLLVDDISMTVVAEKAAR